MHALLQASKMSMVLPWPPPLPSNFMSEETAEQPPAQHPEPSDYLIFADPQAFSHKKAGRRPGPTDCSAPCRVLKPSPQPPPQPSSLLPPQHAEASDSGGAGPPCTEACSSNASSLGNHPSLHSYVPLTTAVVAHLAEGVMDCLNLSAQAWMTASRSLLIAPAGSSGGAAGCSNSVGGKGRAGQKKKGGEDGKGGPPCAPAGGEQGGAAGLRGPGADAGDLRVWGRASHASAWAVHAVFSRLLPATPSMPSAMPRFLASRSMRCSSGFTSAVRMLQVGAAAHFTPPCAMVVRASQEGPRHGGRHVARCSHKGMITQVDGRASRCPHKEMVTQGDAHTRRCPHRWMLGQGFHSLVYGRWMLELEVPPWKITERECRSKTGFGP